MVSVIIIEDEYPDLTTMFDSNISYITAGVYDIIDTRNVGIEIAAEMKNEKNITEMDIEHNIYGYFGQLIEDLKDEIMERLEHCEGCTCEEINGQFVFNKTDNIEELKKEYNNALEFVEYYKNAKISKKTELEQLEKEIKENEGNLESIKTRLNFLKGRKEAQTKIYNRFDDTIREYSDKAEEYKKELRKQKNDNL